MNIGAVGVIWNEARLVSPMGAYRTGLGSILGNGSNRDWYPAALIGPREPNMNDLVLTAALSHAIIWL
jgi:hypothetical protein